MAYIDILWDTCSKDEWETYFSKIPLSNHYQSWPYGEAAHTTTPFSPKRGLIRRRGAFIGLVQVLHRTYLGGIFQHTKLLRGPLYFDTPSLIDQLIVLDSLRTTYKKGLRRQYQFIGELSPTPEALTYFQNKQCVRIAPSFETGLINLSAPMEQLRAQLKGAWRNQLKKAEHSHLAIIMETSPVARDRVIQAFSDLKKRKLFTGPSSSFLRQYLSHTSHVHLAAYHENDPMPMAEIVCVLHGTTATYLLGHTTPKGRKVHATNLLLWRALLMLKEQHIQFFDLGGYYTKRGSRLAHFKKGMGAQKHETLPEYV